MESFEFDKIVIAIAIALFTIIMSSDIGSIFYIPQPTPLKKGFKVEVPDVSLGASSESQGLPKVIDIAAVVAAGNSENGKQIFHKCAVCHTIAKGEPNKIGPNLWDIVGAPTARYTDYTYSSAMQNHGKEGGVWGFEQLYRYLYAPRVYIPGTKMAFAGLKKDSDRADLIAYLRTMSDTPLPLSTEVVQKH